MKDSIEFCPFINGSCRSDCVFYVPYSISTTGGNTTHCELAAFVSCSDKNTANYVFEAIKNLHVQT